MVDDGDDYQGIAREDEHILQKLTERISGFDDLMIDKFYALIEPLEALCNISTIFRDGNQGFRATFDNIRELKSQFYKPLQLGPFLDVYKALAEPASSFMRTYDFMNSQFKRDVEPILKLKNNSEDFTPEKNMPSMVRAFSTVADLTKQATELYISIRLGLSEQLEEVYKYIAQYNQYLTDRFIKPEDSGKKSEQKFLFIEGQAEEKAKYVKIKLLEDNSVLTDILLQFIDTLPHYRHRTVKSNKQKKTIPEISSYAVEESARKLIALSAPKLFSYMQDPKYFFEMIGSELENFYVTFEMLEPAHRQILELPELQLKLKNQADLEQLLEEDPTKVKRILQRFKKADFDSIMQRDDDIMPENRKEIDAFKVRDELIQLLYKSMHDFSIMEKGQDEYSEEFEERKEKCAKDVILRAIELKVKMDDILVPRNFKRLRQNKQEDNEFYVGRQGEIGQFFFERAPTPEVNIDDVIGQSFDKAKDHLNEIIETGKYPHIMRLSAPGGRVRSNILLIGPYGCGKTELARAVCADKRCIGASVSVTSALTAYMHESVNNVKRLYDGAKELYIDGRESKPVVLCLDEFDAWFAQSDFGHAGTDMQQIEDVMLEVLDGMEDYNGIITMAMTNKALLIPKGIMRRFRYVDIVGELTEDERAGMLEMYLERSLPLHKDVAKGYPKWARQLEHAPGDVVRKVVDEIHFDLVPEFIKANPKQARKIEKVLYNRENKNLLLTAKDKKYLLEKLRKHRIINPDDVSKAIDSLLMRPPIRMQINEAKKVYKEARSLIDELSSSSSPGFGLRRKSKIMDTGD